MTNKKCKIAIFASGNGSNTEAIIRHFKRRPEIEVKAIYSNNTSSYVLTRAANHNIPAYTFSKKEFYSEEFIKQLINKNYNLLVLAGFMWLVPPAIVKAYRNKIINIHPALLPLYGGKGMYGHFVHEAVLANKEPKSGITIHFVNEQYDKGDIIFQAKCNINSDDSPDSLAEKIHLLEHRHYPAQIEKICLEISSF